MYIYAYLNDSIQHRTDLRRRIPTDAIRMISPRPEGNYVAAADGSWVLNTKATEIAEAKAYLANTDYIALKLAEAVAAGSDTAPLLDKYADELQHRKDARDKIDELEAML